MNRLLTVGYEKTSLEDFIAALKAAGVTTLLDVREIPISRRKGFSKSVLRDAVTSAGIEYRHERDLGSPKPIRAQLHADGDYSRFFASFTNYLKSQRPLLKSLVAELEGRVALMCFERDATTCHRSIVARHFEQLTGLTTNHIEVASGTGSTRTGAHSCEGVSAA
jgi:uncharacterized protein (DUF488 family)